MGKAGHSNTESGHKTKVPDDQQRELIENDGGCYGDAPKSLESAPRRRGSLTGEPPHDH